MEGAVAAFAADDGPVTAMAAPPVAAVPKKARRLPMLHAQTEDDVTNAVNKNSGSFNIFIVGIWKTN